MWKPSKGKSFSSGCNSDLWAKQVSRTGRRLRTSLETPLESDNMSQLTLIGLEMTCCDGWLLKNSSSCSNSKNTTRSGFFAISLDSAERNAFQVTSVLLGFPQTPQHKQINKTADHRRDTFFTIFVESYAVLSRTELGGQLTGAPSSQES